jgi:glucose/arabinose dehydrogenase
MDTPAPNESPASRMASLAGPFLLLTLAACSLAACGGSDDGPRLHTVTAVASPSGSLGPARSSVEQGASLTLTVSPASGAIVVGVAGCGGALTGPNTYTTGAVTADCTVTATFARAATLIEGLASPWGMVELPDGRWLITERSAGLVLTNADKTAVERRIAVPLPIAVVGQGGLLDIALDPDFATDPWVYLVYAEAGAGAEAGLYATTVARGRLIGNSLTDLQVIHRALPWLPSTYHFGARLAFRADKTLFVTLGERGYGGLVQQTGNAIGKVMRLNRDGSGAVMWSLGHRNPQGAAIRPGTDELWLNEHGPQGGDELDRIIAGGNYGWPVVSYGCNYGEPIGDACRIGGGTHASTYLEPVSYWVPTSIAPAGLVFYTGNRFPQWQGDAFMGALAGAALWRVTLSGNAETGRERLFANLGERIRDVRQGRDGLLYLLTDSGRMVQVRD